MTDAISMQASLQGTGCVRTSFGEVLQGVLYENNTIRHFSVTFPVNMYARAEVKLVNHSGQFSISPAHKRKSARFCKLLLEKLGYSFGAEIRLESEIDEGKGLSSSTADIVAVARALEICLGRDFDPELICMVARDIEPSDGLMYDDCISFYHREVKVKQKLGKLPEFKVIAVDPETSLDTVEYNKQLPIRQMEEAQEYLRLLCKLENAVKLGDAHAIGDVASQSAMLNQKYNYKAFLDDLLQIKEETGACGVIVAHSGTVAGMMLDKNDRDFESRFNSCFVRMEKLNMKLLVCDSL